MTVPELQTVYTVNPTREDDLLDALTLDGPLEWETPEELSDMSIRAHQETLRGDCT
jgi:hypothetical protein